MVDILAQNSYNLIITMKEVTMSFNVEQKVGKYTYVYEAESYWDKEKKQSRQHRKFLGRKDKVTGEIIDTKNKDKTKPVAALDFGTTLFLNSICEKLGITDIIKEMFPDNYKEILALVYYTVIEGDAYYLAEQWAEYTDTNIKSNSIASQRISELLKKIGEDESYRTFFFKEWIKKHKDEDSIYFDITSVSTYSKLIDIAEWGYNRDGESLTQINIGVVYGTKAELPFYYQIYPGSIPDVNTLLNIKKYNQEYGIKNVLYVLDRGFYSKSNLQKIGDEKIIIPLPFSTKLADELINSYDKDLRSPKNMFILKETLYTSTTAEVTINEKKYYAYLYRNKFLYENSETLFYRTLLEIESRISQITFSSEQEILDAIDELSPKFSKYWTITKLSLKRNEKEIEKHISKCGTYIILAPDNSLSKEYLLGLYKRKDNIEKVFNCMKNEIDKDRLHIHSTDNAKGLIFLTFLSLIISTYIEKVIKNSKGRYYTKNEIMYEMKKFRVVKFAHGLKIVNEPTKKVKDLLNLFDVKFDHLLT